MLEHRAPLHHPARAGRAESIVRPGLQVIRVEDRGLLLVQGDATHVQFQDVLRDMLGMALPGAQTATVADDRALLWMTPKEWLLILPGTRVGTVQARLMARFESMLATVTDVSDGLACFDVSGSRASEVLMTGCSLDLRPEAFAAGRAARTAFADVATIFWKPDDAPRLRCLVDRSFAEHFWCWLAESPARS